MRKLANGQDASGQVTGGKTSITQSGGNSLAIEVTALSTLAWIKEPEYAANVERGLKWIVQANKSGRFGSTQSTILALRAIVAYDNAHARPKSPGRLVLTLDGKRVGAPVTFNAGTQNAIVLPELAGSPAPGKHTLALGMEDGSDMPFSMSVKFHSTLPTALNFLLLGFTLNSGTGRFAKEELPKRSFPLLTKKIKPSRLRSRLWEFREGLKFVTTSSKNW
jgi:hypothetical protein